MLLGQCSLALAYEQVNPLAFAPAIAPHLAAREAGVELSAARLHEAVREVLALQADFTLVEGAGGWRVPLLGRENLSDLARLPFERWPQALGEMRRHLAERLPAPCLGRVPRLEEATPAAVAAHLDLRPLGIGL